VTTATDNLVWRHHGEWWDSYESREKKLFGTFKDNELEDLITISQYLQAEGLRYVIESNRRRTWENCGSIIWQLNEPWPNVACTNLIEYYGTPKLAYYFVRDAYRNIAPSLKYVSLYYQAGQTFKADIYVLNDGSETTGKVISILRDDSSRALMYQEYSTTLNANTATYIGPISFQIIDKVRQSFTVEVIVDVGRRQEKSIYLFLVQDKQTGLLSKQAVLRYVSWYKSEMIGIQD
jgi:beta-mannosidase